MSCPADCHDCGVPDAAIAALEAKLAEVTVELETEKEDSHEWHRMFQEAAAEVRTLRAEVVEAQASLPSIQAHAHGMGQDCAIEEIDALRAEVARLRAAIEELPCTCRGDYCYGDCPRRQLRAVLGEVNAPGSSLRERVEAARRPGGAMSRKSWAAKRLDLWSEGPWPLRTCVDHAIRETIEECARQCDEPCHSRGRAPTPLDTRLGIKARILALLEPGDEP